MEPYWKENGAENPYLNHGIRQKQSIYRNQIDSRRYDTNGHIGGAIISIKGDGYGGTISAAFSANLRPRCKLHIGAL
jgi:hypothetical protein